VPAAWEVQQRLLRDAATASGESPEDVFAWWLERTGDEARYDDILYATARTPSARMNILRPMFEPTDADRNAGIKVPSAAHRALAAMMRDGLIRIIVTLNFDLLIETALRDLGIEPTVVSTPDDVAGMEPLHAQQYLVWHLHGDYTNPAMLNTPDELRAYPDIVNTRLDELFDQYGLLVVGWSAKWDSALVSALERCPSRRYPAFWLDHSKLTGPAERLAVARDAVTATAGADEWLSDVLDACTALADRTTDPVTTVAAAHAAKRELASGATAIATHDRLEREADRLASLDVLSHAPSVFDTISYVQRLPLLEDELELWTTLVGTLGYWGNSHTDAWWLRHLARWAAPVRLSGATNAIYSLASPAVTALYGAGTAAVAAGRWSLVARLLLGPRVGSRRTGATMPACFVISPSDMYASSRWASRELFHYVEPLLVEAAGLSAATVKDAWEVLEYLVLAAAIDRGKQQRDVRPPVALPYVRVDDNWGRGRHEVDVLARRWLDRNPGMQELTERVFAGDNDRVDVAFAEADAQVASEVSRLESSAMPMGRADVMPSGIRYPPMPA
jgi:hypothetical protein